MITVLFEDCKDFSQDIYDQTIDCIQLHMVECTCGRKGCLIRYGHYKRHVKFLSCLIPLSVQRVWCRDCEKTNALIPSLLVPYSQVPLEDQQEILACRESGRSPEAVMERNYLVDESCVKYICRQFKKHWKERLATLRLSLTDCLTVPCLGFYSMQFMQVRKMRNKLCTQTNIP